MIDLSQPSLLTSSALINQNQSQDNLNIPQEILDKGKKKKKLIKKAYDFGPELRKLSTTRFTNGNNNDTPIDLVKKVGKAMNISPELLLSSSWVEGLNKRISDPSGVSEAYYSSDKKDPIKNTYALATEYPVDGFYNYGLDTFGDMYNKELSKYLPAGFGNRFKSYPAVNELNQNVNTAAFRSDEDALMAKAAYLIHEGNKIDNWAKQNNVPLDEKAKNYFTMAAYNGGPNNAIKMLKEYALAKDKNEFIDKGLTSRKGVHKNISKRMNLLPVSRELIYGSVPNSGQQLNP